MPDDTDSINPYQPPTAANDSIAGAVRSFPVGVHETTTVYVEASVWRGIRTYVKMADGEYSQMHRGPCQFEFGDGERHEVKIQVNSTGAVNAYVDGKLIDSNMFASLRARIFTIVAIFIVTCFAAAVYLAAWFFKA